MLEKEYIEVGENTSKHVINKVQKGSIAEELGIEVGDILLAIDDKEIEDVFDYRYYINSESMLMLIQKKDGEVWELDIEHNYEDIGIEFGSGLMCDYRTCTNNCVFCFIDQMPKGMRDTLYFKDDDSRLSFLQGNYITLTNMKEKDIDRIIEFRLAPINISVHTTNPELRVRMLHNRFAGTSLKYIDKLYEHEIPMNGQIVMCKGYNDGAELERSIKDLLKYAPVMESVSVVPVGITKYRTGLAKLQLIDKKTAEETIDMIEKYQKKAKELHGINFIHASDELYLLAERELPEEERYDGYIQLGNGVGMLRLLRCEVASILEDIEAGGLQIEKETVSIATGKLAAPTISKLAKDIEKHFPEKKINVYTIENDFFGEHITVAGLITGKDLIKQLKGKDLGSRLLLSINMFKSSEDIFLDNFTKNDIESRLNISITKVGTSGDDLIKAILNKDYVGYESFLAYEPDEEVI